MKLSEKQETQLGDFYVHFDVKDHSIPVEQSIITEDAVKVVFEEFAKVLFGSDVDLQILVLPEVEGSLLKRFKITTMVVGSFVLGQLSPDIMNGIIMGVGDGREAKEYVSDGTKYLLGSVRYFFEQDALVLRDQGFAQDKFKRSYIEKNKFYEAAIENKKLNGVGFDNGNSFAVLPERFPYKLANLEDGDEEKVIRKIHRLRIVAPITTKEHQRDAWRVKDWRKGSTEHVYFKDKEFYEYYWEHDLKVHILVAQVKYTFIEDLYGNVRLKDKGKEIEIVFQYDDQKYRDFPQKYKISKFPYKINENISEDNKENSKKEESQQTSLFD